MIRNNGKGSQMYSHGRILRFFAALAVAATLTGCLARQVARDGINARQALLELYTDQVMDNLIRAHNNMPFVQVSYHDVTVQDNDQLGSGVTGAWPGSMFGANGNASRSMTLSVVANPITDQNDIYDSYVAFASDPGLFQVTCDDPGCMAHICREQDKIYYWVPVEAAPLFLELALSTTFKRGPESAPPGAYEVTILSAVPEYTNRTAEGKVADDSRPGDLQAATLTLSAEIPSGNATMVTKLKDGRTFKIDLVRIPTRMKDGKKVPVKDGDPTTEFKTENWSPKATGYTHDDLRGAKARIYSHEFPMSAPDAGPRTLQGIGSNLNFLRNQQGQFRR